MRTKTNPVDGATLVYVPPGTFRMGGEIYQREHLHTVEISAGFWIYQERVTFDQYRRFLNATGYEARNARAARHSRDVSGFPGMTQMPTVTGQTLLSLRKRSGSMPPVPTQPAALLAGCRKPAWVRW